MDEAHLLKDRSSYRSKKLRDIAHKAKQRLMLTGTPLQNDLQVLNNFSGDWHIFNFKKKVRGASPLWGYMDEVDTEVPVLLFSILIVLYHLLIISC